MFFTSLTRFAPDSIPDDIPGLTLTTLTDWWFRQVGDPVGEVEYYADGKTVDWGRWERRLEELFEPGDVVALDIEPGNEWVDAGWAYRRFRDEDQHEELLAHQRQVVNTLRIVGKLWMSGQRLRPDLDWRAYTNYYPLRDRYYFRQNPIPNGVMFDPALPSRDRLSRTITGTTRAGLSMYLSDPRVLSNERWLFEKRSQVARCEQDGIPFDAWITGRYVNGSYAFVSEAEQTMARSVYEKSPMFRDTIYWADGGRPRTVSGNRIFTPLGNHVESIQEARSIAGIHPRPVTL